MENPVINTLHNLIDYDISKFVSAENELKMTLPKWISIASSFQLKTALQKYLDFVGQHLLRLEEFIDQEEISLLNVNNRIMRVLIEETQEELSHCSNVEVKDACLLARVQAINHFKICLYGTAAAFAKLLELNKSAEIFHEAEINEKHIDDRLSQLAEYEVNLKAKSPIALP